MPTAFDIGSLWTILADIFAFFNKRKSDKNEKLINAHKSINKAFIQTYDYLRNKKGKYKPMPDLANAWNEASAEVMKINPALGNMLFIKSRFWTDPDLYFNLNRQEEAIELERIIDEMEMLRLKLS